MGEGSKGRREHTVKTWAETLVWIGGLVGIPEGKENAKKLKEHFKNLGHDPKYVEFKHKGNAGAAFDTEGQAAAAIAEVNGTELMGKTLKVDVWLNKKVLSKSK